MKILIAIKLLIFLSIVDLTVSFSGVNAQDATITGRVTTLNNIAVNNIKVESKKTGNKVSTDSTGFVSIVCSQKDRLIFSGEVFRTSRLRVRPSVNELNMWIDFIDNEENIKKAVLLGYFVDELALQETLNNYNTNSNCNYLTIKDLIKAKFPAIIYDSETCFMVRGSGSLNSSSCALFVVDGVVMEDISNISPCDVEEIKLIKDESATMYGVRGANGVFIITLRKNNF